MLTAPERKSDPTLGAVVKDYLIGLGLEAEGAQNPNWNEAWGHMQTGVHMFLSALGQLPDPSRDDTPNRVAKMFVQDLCWGLDYSHFPKCTTTPNGALRTTVEGMAGGGQQQKQHTKEELVGRYDQMVRVAKIQTISLCEHHFQTIYGHTHIAYIPNKSLLGLSKFARITEFFARRPQIQERMTEQIFASLCLILGTKDVAVVQDCTHYCMKARGAMQQDALTRTDRMGGRFLSVSSLREEFFHGLK